MVRGHKGGISIALCGVFFLACLHSGAQEQPPPNPQIQHAAFVFLQRTSRHVKYSKPEIFQAVVEDVFAHLKSMNVSMASDEFGGRRYSEEEMTLEAVQKIARDSKADSLLYLVVDRPIAKWIRVVAQCYDASGKLLWREEAASGGGVTGGHGLRVTLDRLHQRLDQHLGHEGLPLVSEEGAKEEHHK
jgi:hypothetical protein